MVRTSTRSGAFPKVDSPSASSDAASSGSAAFFAPLARIGILGCKLGHVPRSKLPQVDSTVAICVDLADRGLHCRSVHAAVDPKTYRAELRDWDGRRAAATCENQRNHGNASLRGHHTRSRQSTDETERENCRGTRRRSDGGHSRGQRTAETTEHSHRWQ